MAAEMESGERSSSEGSGEQSSRTPTADLLSRFGVSECPEAVLTGDVSEGEVELSLSLGGYFGTEPEKNRVVRGLSISGLSMYDDEGAVQPIVKPRSHPMESDKEEEEEEEVVVRKRKVLQSLKRLEVKRRRFERRVSRTGAKHGGVVDRRRSISQRSVGSQGPSGLSDFDCRLEDGSSGCKEVKISPLSILLSLNRANKVANSIVSMEEGKLSNKKFDIADKANELVRSRLEGKLCVSTQGDGPNGRMIQGLLYKYGHGVDVRIVCVCHGSFLTPAEFVKHSGGGDVAHPLRHIVVNHRRPFVY